ncbi:MAG: type 1 glutamine amidotransferase domain-containing protein [Polyangiales bacterium]
MTNDLHPLAPRLHPSLLAVILGALALAACSSHSSIATENAPSTETVAGEETQGAAPRVLFVLSTHDTMAGEPTGAFLPELAHGFLVFEEAGWAVDFVSPNGGRIPLYAGDDDERSQAFMQREELVARLHRSMTPADVDASAYAAIYFVGGHGTMWDFPNQPALASLGEAIYAQGGIVSAVCHGPAGLIGLRDDNGEPLIRGRRVAAFTDDEERAVGHEEHVPFLLQSRLEELGATVVTQPIWQPNVQTDGRLVTGQNPASAEGVAQAVVELLEAP